MNPYEQIRLKMEKIKVNNQVVMMRKYVKQAKIRVLNKYARQIKQFQNKKGDEKILLKNKRKIERLLEKISLVKKIKPDSVSKLALSKAKDWKFVLEQKNIPLEEHCIAILASHGPVQAEVEKFHSENSSLVPKIPSLILEWDVKLQSQNSGKKNSKFVEPSFPNNIKLTKPLQNQSVKTRLLSQCKHVPETNLGAYRKENDIHIKSEEENSEGSHSDEESDEERDEDSNDNIFNDTIFDTKSKNESDDETVKHKKSLPKTLKNRGNKIKIFLENNINENKVLKSGQCVDEINICSNDNLDENSIIDVNKVLSKSKIIKNKKMRKKSNVKLQKRGDTLENSCNINLDNSKCSPLKNIRGEVLLNDIHTKLLNLSEKSSEKNPVDLRSSPEPALSHKTDPFFIINNSDEDNEKQENSLREKKFNKKFVNKGQMFRNNKTFKHSADFNERRQNKFLNNKRGTDNSRKEDYNARNFTDKPLKFKDQNSKKFKSDNNGFSNFKKQNNRFKEDKFCKKIKKPPFENMKGFKNAEKSDFSKETRNNNKYHAKNTTLAGVKKSIEKSDEPLHPSWQAKRKEKETIKTGFTGKRIVFDD